MGSGELVPPSCMYFKAELYTEQIPYPQFTLFNGDFRSEFYYRRQFLKASSVFSVKIFGNRKYHSNGLAILLIWLDLDWTYVGCLRVPNFCASNSSAVLWGTEKCTFKAAACNSTNYDLHFFIKVWGMYIYPRKPYTTVWNNTNFHKRWFNFKFNISFSILKRFKLRFEVCISIRGDCISYWTKQISINSNLIFL